ncbi:hypothetical protein NC652_004539 [Populus alba x Populus x berolinensis]|uniref:Uncharacterized protein n=1 Tax=Populus alba x Populus x berolinensis TaxID=444605 RepID=A0AAD6RU52_9ROSI|nr:hypothetical protein NC652_004539 [Populus alba x Populus x berolinensis]KAJ7015208.1 hypothetical protein NC653_004502 [Populus alba x Populus x berolinensis]
MHTCDHMRPKLTSGLTLHVTYPYELLSKLGCLLYSVRDSNASLFNASVVASDKVFTHTF